MTPDRAGKMAGIKEQIERGQYRVDPGAVADAILRRLGQGWPLLDGPNAYTKCSYPESSGPEGPNRNPLAP
jgi:Anti-sigma-28 factor, FlgM